MNFDTIRFDGTTVELAWHTKENGVPIHHEIELREPPKPELADALKAFKPFVADLLEMPASWVPETEVRGIILSEQAKTGRQQLQVTVVRKIERIQRKGVVINTPVIAQPADENAEPKPGYITEPVMKLIGLAEEAAAGYVRGERGQVDAFAEPSATKKNGKRKGGKKDKRQIEAA